jgi:hypothetical protein
MISIDDVGAMLNKVDDITYGTDCIDGLCGKLEECNDRGYCIVAAEYVKGVIDGNR